MGSFSLNRVFQYARYHYTTLQSKYLIRLLIITGLPLLFGVLGRDVESACQISSVVYLFASLGFASLSVYPMRDRGLKTIEMGVPVSNGERMTFLVLNLVVVYPLLLYVCAWAVTLIASLFSPYSYSFVEIFDLLCDCDFGDWWFHVTCQFFAAGTLLINLLARRSLFVAYLIAFCGFIALFSFVGSVLGALSNMGVAYENTIYITPEIFDEVIEPIIKTIYSLLPVSIYAICYVVLRKRQIKW